MRVTPIALAPLGLLLLACGATVNTNPMLGQSTTTLGSTPAAPVSSAPVSSAPGSSAPTTPSASASGAAQNLTVTNALRADLLAAAAQERGLTPSDFTGLRPGATYYAYDPTTQTYWAGAGLVPSPSSQQAMVSSQDDGAYTLFERSSSGSWTPKEAGMAGLGGGPCPLPIPDSVVRVWGWPAGACHPTHP